MATTTRFRRTIGLATGLVLLAGSASALTSAPATAATVLGSLAISPAIGTAVDPITLTTVSSGAAKGCPADTTNIVGTVTGPGGWAGGVLGVGNTSADVSTSADFPAQLSNSFTVLAQNNNLTVLPGKYTITLSCIDELGITQFGDFVGNLWFTSATSYQTTDPAAPVVTATTTTLAVAPSGSAVAGAPVTLTATVSPAAAGGSVQFTDTVAGATVNVGAPVPVVSGVAGVSTTTLAQGAHQLKAAFTPTSAAAYTGSTSATIGYTVTAAPTRATPTTTTIAATPASGAVAGAPVTLTASVAPAAAAGTVQFTDTVGGVTGPVGSPVTVAAGSASLVTTSLAAENHSLTAVFTPADPAAYGTSTSTALGLQVGAPATPPAVTGVALAASPASGASIGDVVTLTATVTPAGARGIVQFTDGDGVIGVPVPLTGATASTSTTALPAGNRSLRAIFTPTDAAAYAASTSLAVPYTVTAKGGPAATDLTLAAAPAGTAEAGAAVTYTATVSPAAAGTVTFTSTPAGGTASPIGSPVQVAGGTAAVTSSDLPVGVLSIGAAFTPADATAFQASTASPLTYTVKAPGTSPRPTTTSLTTGPLRVGTDVQLSAAVSPAAAGTVQFTDTVAGTTSPLGAPVPVAGGTATVTTRFTVAGTHTLKASFSPADPAAFAASSSERTAEVEAATNPSAKPTSVQLSVWRTSWCPGQSRRVVGHQGDDRGWKARRCDGAVLIAEVKPGEAAGSVQFTNTVGGVTYPAGAPVQLWNGWAVLFVEIPAGHNLGGATFVPADPAAFAPSTSNQVPVKGGSR